MNIREVIQLAIQKGASDIHLEVGRPVSFRIHGDIVSVGEQALTPTDTENYLRAITDDSHR